MKIGVFSSFVVLSHLVLGICTFHDTVYLHFHYVSLRKKEQNILLKKKKPALTLKAYAS